MVLNAAADREWLGPSWEEFCPASDVLTGKNCTCKGTATAFAYN